MSENWRFYLSNVNNAIASLSVDLAVKEKSPDPSRPFLLYVWVEFRDSRTDGLSSQAESAMLFKIDDSLNASISARLHGQYVGRITTQGRREFYYYSPSAAGLEEAVTDAMKQYPDYRFTSGSQEDPLWTQYSDVLYPSPIQLQAIENAPLIEQLTKHGDALTIPRPIVHYAYFREFSQANTFVEDIQKKGYSVSSRSNRPNDGDRPFGVVFQREAVPSLAAVNEMTQDLCILASSLDGEYDGWETQVIRPAAPGNPLSNMFKQLFKGSSHK